MPSFTLSRRHALIAVACALAVVFAASRFLGGPKAGTATAVSGGEAASAPPLTTPATATPAVSAVVVDVAGAVRRPGLYRLPDGSRNADAIARAGGATPKADASLVNLAAPLADGEQVLVPAKAGVVAAPAAGADPSVPSPQAPVDLNTATAEQLDALPGIGPVTAQKIVDYRQQHGPYTSVDDLDAIAGIGPSRIDNLRSLVIA
jgi:competence protein ComEA